MSSSLSRDRLPLDSACLGPPRCPSFALCPRVFGFGKQPGQPGQQQFQAPFQPQFQQPGQQGPPQGYRTPAESPGRSQGQPPAEITVGFPLVAGIERAEGGADDSGVDMAWLVSIIGLVCGCNSARDELYLRACSRSLCIGPCLPAYLSFFCLKVLCYTNGVE